MSKYQDKYVSNFFADESENIQEKTQDLAKLLVELMVEANFSEINCLLQETKVMSYSIQGYIESLKLADKEKDMLLHAGYNSALLDLMRLYTKKLYVQEEINRIKTGYKDKVLRILDKRGTLLHKDLAGELKVTPSGLTAIIKQMNATSVKLINTEEFSKFKMYSLTAIARYYIEKSMSDKTDGYIQNQRYLHYRFEQEKINDSTNRLDGQEMQRTQQLVTPNHKYDQAKGVFGDILNFSEKKSKKQRVRPPFDPPNDTLKQKRA